MAELNDRPNAQGGAEPKRVDNVGGAPLPPGAAQGSSPPVNAPKVDQVLETPEEKQRRAQVDKNLHKDEEAGAAVAATGLGCLSLALLPWSVGIVILVAILLMWLFHGGH